MFGKILDVLTGKDDLERVAAQGDLRQLNAYLKTRPIYVPQKPKRFLDASSFTQEDLLKQIELDVEELANDSFEPWIIQVDDKKQLPVFSSQARMKVFSAKISTNWNKVFSLGCVSILLEDVTKQVKVDLVTLNPFCKQSWEIGIG
jgi:hypothetical protein